MSSSDLDKLATCELDTEQLRQVAEESSRARLYPYTYEEAEVDDDEAPGTERTRIANLMQEVRLEREGPTELALRSACKSWRWHASCSSSVAPVRLRSQLQ